MLIKGTARFSLFGSAVVENTTIESQSSVTVDFKWSHVEAILETPPLSSSATLVGTINSHSKQAFNLNILFNLALKILIVIVHIVSLAYVFLFTCRILK